MAVKIEVEEVEVEEVEVEAEEAVVVVATEEIALALEVAQGSNHPISDPRLALQEELDKERGSHQHPHHHPVEEARQRRMDFLRLSQT